MDTQKIGKFLKELRREHNMTQEELGEKIGVTNKTISRWETGNYMPPVENLKLLSELYQVSINEILSGERLNQENYKEVADANISIALEEIEESHKKFENKMLLIMGITCVLAWTIIYLLPDGKNLTDAERIKLIIAVILVVAMAFISNTLNICAMALKKHEKGTL